MVTTTALDAETAKKVIRQVEFYFSDSNLPRDSFLRQSISDSEDGMVSLALVCSFTRMKLHLKLGDEKAEDISEDTVKAVAETLRTSSFLKVSEDGQKVGRVTEMAKPEEVIEQLDVRTVAVSPLPYNVKIEDVESLFGQSPKVNSVRLPRHVADKRLFSGTALVEFSSEEDAAAILGQSLVFAGIELELKPKKDFDMERAKQEEEAENSRHQHGSKHKNNSSPDADYPKGLIVAFKLKSIRGEGATDKNGNHEPAANVVHSTKSDETSEVATDLKEQDPSENATDQANNENADGNEVKDVEKEGVDAEVLESGDAENALGGSDLTKDDQAVAEGKSTFAANKDNKDVVLREDLKSAFEKFGTVKYVDFKMGEDSGYIRFEDAGASQKARAAAVLAEEGGLVLKNFVAILDPVTGEAEKEYWGLLRSNQRRDNFKGNRGRGGKHHHYKGRKNSRSRENDSSGSLPNKAQKVGAA